MPGPVGCVDAKACCRHPWSSRGDLRLTEEQEALPVSMPSMLVSACNRVVTGSWD